MGWDLGKEDDVASEDLVKDGRTILGSLGGRILAQTHVSAHFRLNSGAGRAIPRAVATVFLFFCFSKMPYSFLGFW
jgi:hypothetical protein